MSKNITLKILVSTDEKIMGYDPDDPNLVDEPDFDVENPYEGLAPGRPDPVSRVLMPTAGRHSPDSIGQGNKSLKCFSTLIYCYVIALCLLLTHSLINHFSSSWLW